AEPRERVDAGRDRLLLRVDGLQRREPAEVGDVRRARHLLALRAEQPLEPAFLELSVHLGRGLARRGQRAFQLADRDPLLLLVALDRAFDAADLGLELLAL